MSAGCTSHERRIVHGDRNTRGGLRIPGVIVRTIFWTRLILIGFFIFLAIGPRQRFDLPPHHPLNRLRLMLGPGAVAGLVIEPFGLLGEVPFNENGCRTPACHWRVSFRFCSIHVRSCSSVIGRVKRKKHNEINTGVLS
jgi:hypothetical protein